MDVDGITRKSLYDDLASDVYTIILCLFLSKPAAFNQKHPAQVLFIASILWRFKDCFFLKTFFKQQGLSEFM
ncbi:hypothetical protein A1OO_07830 [Enterovibrio norvegicus FF-33]|uniref:Uncharacterized protein n=1 Tax=Enterovibrio norvegicus FF-454 TaxID=1185651 RepID=A0A1E5C9C1_9GAMM|nr:hypothetical protein A1OK_01055 [Enterovibrio norvegicus FF-454]OEE65710.1 hypothetical protein A1OO_07830 [Enterovibrio norvegicus FF-33]OEE90124.1 hypothetical protein A1OQ_10990 [Enterovibrio norvegicus FF-162]